ncbi:hypothetical protein IE077_002948 [Cardiosporidium cionae]|uniref:Uncharacterized protein n=1 Tax=Cardiosporidium cionae TaxID=476202 RepID=A0ABQ7JFB4_9APIC|nr:hypothetical protein IE077_002948 [Cardiosporidium cionae]|eukprot:KAF8822712.1 hypothetical protein IE077_002948 [Cardiosporidium cionae]
MKKKTLRLLNQFVISLYEDLELLLIYNEQQQLKKISLLCQQALVDETKLSSYAESMKSLFDSDFFAYLSHAIQHINPDTTPSNWLLILTIIKRGILSIFQDEVWEDGLWITTLVTQRQPEVRETLLKMMIANLPKADWKQFKAVARAMIAGLKRRPQQFARLSYPWIFDALNQLGSDLERSLPDWLIEGLLSEEDRFVMNKTAAVRSVLWRQEEMEKIFNVTQETEKDTQILLTLLENEKSKITVMQKHESSSLTKKE